MRRIIPCLCLSACVATPAPGFFGATRHDVTLEGIDFVVYHKDDRAEVLRMGYMTRRERDPVPRLMEQAIAATTGCRAIPGSMVTGLQGDTGEARFDLDCR